MSKLLPMGRDGTNMGNVLGVCFTGSKRELFCRWERLWPVFRPKDRKRLRVMEGEDLCMPRSKILEKK